MAMLWVASVADPGFSCGQGLCLDHQIGIGIEIAIENQCQHHVSGIDFDPDSDFDLG